MLGDIFLYNTIPESLIYNQKPFLLPVGEFLR